MDKEKNNYDGVDLTELLDEEMMETLIKNLKKEFSKEEKDGDDNSDDDDDDEWIRNIEKKIKGN